MGIAPSECVTSVLPPVVLARRPVLGLPVLAAPVLVFFDRDEWERFFFVCFAMRKRPCGSDEWFFRPTKDSARKCPVDRVDWP